jgi:hypothetical protein
MRLIYFDEVKYNPPKQNKHWIGALSIPSEVVPDIESRMNEVAHKLFGSNELTRSTEFHAVDMIHGKAHFKGRDIVDRLAALEGILSIANDERIRRITVSVAPERMVAPHTVSDKAFLFLVEKAQHDLTKVHDTGILIGDLDTQYADEGVSNLSRYRERGTPYAYGKTIDRLIDSVYFIPSHHSRMLQLADAYAYTLQLLHSSADGDSYPKARIRGFIGENTNLSWPNSYKDWPSNDSWALGGYAA